MVNKDRLSFIRVYYDRNGERLTAFISVPYDMTHDFIDRLLDNGIGVYDDEGTVFIRPEEIKRVSIDMTE